MDVDQLPFNQLIGIQRREGMEEGIYELSDDEKYHNHLGTVHASALYALAEASSGQFLVENIKLSGDSLLPVLRRSEVKYRKAANGAIRSIIDYEPEVWVTFYQTLEKRKRAMLSVEVSLLDRENVQVAVATFEWFIALRD